MFKVIICMAVGIIAGRYFRARGLQKPIIAVTWLLLLFLGWEAGSDRSVIEALPSIGLAAAILSLGGIAGSCALAWILWRSMNGKTERDGCRNRKLEADGVDTTDITGIGVADDGHRDTCRAEDSKDGRPEDSEKGRVQSRASLWSGMGGSLVILGFFIAGICLGISGLFPGSNIVHKLSFWSLCILMMMVGMSVGGNPDLVSSIKSMNPRVALLPLATILGTYAGCIIVNLFLGYGLADILAVSSGFGYYSLSSVLISGSRGPPSWHYSIDFQYNKRSNHSALRPGYGSLGRPVGTNFGGRRNHGGYHIAHHFQLLWRQVRADFHLSRLRRGLLRAAPGDAVLLAGAMINCQDRFYEEDM